MQQITLMLQELWLYNIKELKWDEKYYKLWIFQNQCYQKLKIQVEHFGYANLGGKGGHRVPIAGVAGDQQSALLDKLVLKKENLKILMEQVVSCLWIQEKNL